MKMSLASALAVIGRTDAELENKAQSVLRIVRAKRMDLKAFGAAVRQAYKANGWNGKPGKPKAGSKSATVPPTVKQYVSTIRRAFRAGLPVGTYSSVYALREDLRKAAAKARKPAAPVKPEMLGIHLRQPDVLTGSPFHDLAVLYNALDRARRPRMLAALERVKRDFSAAAPQLVVASLPEMRKAA